MTRLAAVLGAAALLVPGTAAAGTAPGSLDNTFSSDGRVRLGFGGSYDEVQGRDLVVRGSGKVTMVAAVTRNDRTFFGLTRLRKDGSPDPRFSRDGRRTVTFAGSDVPRRVVALDGGRVLVAGTSGGAFALAAVRNDGTLDPTFGGNGKVATDVTDGADTVLDLSPQPDGSILAAGVVSGGRFAVARYLSDGTLDPSYGDGGVVLTESGFDGDPTMVRLQPDGKLLAIGTSTYNADYQRGYSVARYDVDGSFDQTFGGGDGRTVTYRYDLSIPNAVVVDEQGRILVGGTGYGEGDYSSFFVVRYLPDGELDPAFGLDGRVENSNDYYATLNALALDEQGRIVGAGWSSREGLRPNTLAVTRYTGDGKVDATFGRNGIVWVGFGADVSSQARAVVARDGKIVAVGEQAKRGRTLGAVVRLHQ